MSKTRWLQIFLLLQPVLDLITSFQSIYFDFGISLSVLIRGLAVIVAGIYLLLQQKSKRLRQYMMMLGLYTIIYFIHIYLVKGSPYLIQEIYGYIRFYYFPILIIFFYHMLKNEKDIKSILKPVIVYSCLFYFFIAFIAFITGTSIPSYMGDDKIGFNGWFYSANERGNTYALLLPLLIPLYIKNNKYIFIILLGIFSLLVLGTKVGYLSVIIMLGATLLYFMIDNIKKNRLHLFIFFTILLFTLGITPFLPVYKNIQIQNSKINDILEEKQNIDQENLENKIEVNDAYLIEDKNNNLIFSGREVYLQQNVEYFSNQSISSKLFGVGFENKYLDQLKIANKVEIDLFDTFFAFGIIGFILYWIPFLFFLFSILGKLMRKYQNIFQLNTLFLLISTMLAIIISILSGHVFVAPSVSIFVICIINMLYFHLDKEVDTLNKVLFISSTGGHLSELLQLKELFSKYDYHIITEKTKSNMELLKLYPKKVNYLVYGTKSHILSYMFKFPYNIMKSLYFFLKIRPKVIVTTGAHTCVPMCYIGKLFGSKIIYIETFANIHTKTITGRLIYPIADVFVVQWESMLQLYPKAQFGGWIY